MQSCRISLPAIADFSITGPALSCSTRQCVHLFRVERGKACGTALRYLRSAFHDCRNFIQMRIDLARDFVEVAPLLAKLRRLMGRSQQIAVLPLHVVDDAAAIETAMQADGNKARLTRHEA